MPDLNFLIDSWLRGDERAAETLYNMHRDQTYRLAFGVLGNHEDAEEATQDALTYALMNIRRYDATRSKFTTWLYTITISRCRDIQRKQKSSAFSLLNLFKRARQTQPTSTTPEMEAIQNETKSTVWQAVQQLSPSTREAVILRHWGGHPYHEIAEIVGCSMKTAQSRVRIAHEQLAKILNTNDINSLREKTI